MQYSETPSIDSEKIGVWDIVPIDVFGHFPRISKRGARYFVTFVDKASRWVEVFSIEHTSDFIITF